VPPRAASCHIVPPAESLPWVENLEDDLGENLAENGSGLFSVLNLRDLTLFTFLFFFVRGSTYHMEPQRSACRLVFLFGERTTNRSWLGPQKFFRSHTNIPNDLPQQRWRNIPALVEWNGSKASISVSKLLVRPSLTNFDET
jgi:hypothetical protein